MKKILFLTPSLAIGGAERVLVNLLKRIDYTRFDVTLCLYSNFGEYLDEVPAEVKKCHIFNSVFWARVFTYLQRKLQITFPIRFLTKKAIHSNFDVGICFSDGLLTDTLIFAKNRFAKKISWVHSCYKSQDSLRGIYTPGYVQKLINTRYSLLDEIVFVSENSKNEFEELFGKSSKHMVVHNVFDPDSIVKKADVKLSKLFNEEIINIVTIGRLVKVKEYAKLVEAASILAKKGLTFHIRIIGGGKLNDVLSGKIAQLQLTDYVELTGFISNPYPYLKNSNILVLTSSSEALPTVLIEAMALNVPIVSTACSGAIEITDNGKYALLTDHSVTDIAEKLGQMIEDSALRKYYSKKSSERLKFFDETEVLKKVHKLLED